MSAEEVKRDEQGKIINSLDKRIALWKACIHTAEVDPSVRAEVLTALRAELAQMVAEKEQEGQSHGSNN